MKKGSFITAILFLFAAWAASSCNEGMYADLEWVPVDIEIYATQNGNDILDSTKPWYQGKDLRLTFEGSVYKIPERGSQSSLVSGEGYKGDGESFNSTFYGLRLLKAAGRYYLYFGDFDGSKDMDTKLVLNWPDGKEDVISYKRKVNAKRHKADVTIKLNGEKCYIPVQIGH